MSRYEKNSSRVPAYQNLLKVVGFCDFQVAFSPYRGRPWWGWMSLDSFSAPEKMNNKTFASFFDQKRKNKKSLVLS